nr:hypothetical protein [Caballeronia sp. AZ7_KS35]
MGADQPLDQAGFEAITQNALRVANNDCIWRNVLRYDCTCSDNCSSAYRDSGKYGRIRTDPNIVFKNDVAFPAIRGNNPMKGRIGGQRKLGMLSPKYEGRTMRNRAEMPYAECARRAPMIDSWTVHMAVTADTYSLHGLENGNVHLETVRALPKKFRPVSARSSSRTTCKYLHHVTHNGEES